ncbi:5-formyltetrahydrofolate cyclo-ligase [Endomicrobiia bacterium]|nr:5-formyltetrahydrofolate cyclo-ligase [Endomicrobiia bacterium]GHT74914.1 5-formyltetrahydrofolate cyclo-ligase [Endomicrobiia bacterium]
MSDYLESEKRKLRTEFLSLRNRMDSVSVVAYSVDIFAKIEMLATYKKARTVMFYLSCGSEVATDSMITSAIKEGKIVAVPTLKNTIDKQLQVVKISKLEDACQLVYGIRQPEINPNDIVEKDNIDLVFVPGVAFDVLGYRIGYGKGYYDRWLESVPISKTIALAYDFQITKKLPIGKHDIPVGTIVTERQILKSH